MKATITLTQHGQVTPEEWQQFVADLVQRNTPYLGRHGVTSEFVVRNGKRVSAGAGGGKGTKVIETLQQHPDWSRRQVAEACGCAVSRVGEVMRAAGIKREKPQHPTDKATADAALAKGKAAVQKAVAEDPELQRAKEALAEEAAEAIWSETRSEKCEHERKAKKRAGTCKHCPTYVEPAAA